MSSIGKHYLYICSFNEKGKWNVRKVDKRSSETISDYDIKDSECECKGYKRHDKCKHLEMITGKFTKGKGIREIDSDDVEEVKEFLANHVKAQFGAECEVKFREEHGDISERFDVLCEADERKLLWTQLLTPIETEEETGFPVLVRIIFTTSYKDDLEGF
ncbi:MAG: hypothetical protein ACOC5T_01065 [Elusimicrobiota bacterium]